MLGDVDRYYEYMEEEHHRAKLVNDSFSVIHCGNLHMNDDHPTHTQTHYDVSGEHLQSGASPQDISDRAEGQDWLCCVTLM